MKQIIDWLILKWCPDCHRHKNSVRKTSDFVSPVPEFTTDGLPRPASEGDQSDQSMEPSRGEEERQDE